MALRDLISNIKESVGFNPELLSADENGVTFDMQGFESLVAFVLAGVSLDTLSGSVFVEFILQHGDLQDGSDAVAVTSADDVLPGTALPLGVFATIDDPAEDDAVYKIGYRGTKRYVRVVADFTGTHTNGFPLAVLGIKGDASNQAT